MRWWIVVALGLGIAAGGCREQDSPSPELNVGVAVGDGARTLLPTVVPSQADQASTILGPAVSAEEVGPGKAAAAGEAAASVVKIKIDDSTAEGLMKGLVAVIEAGNFAQLPDLFVPEQQEFIRQVAGAIGPLAQGFKALEAKWKEKFPDSPPPASGLQQGPGLDALLAPPKVTEVKETSDTEAEATTENPGGGEAEKVQLKKVENAWRIHDPKLNMQGDAETMKKFLGAFAELGKAFQELAGRLENDEFASAADAEKALGEVGQKVMGPLMAEMMAKMAEGMKNAGGQPAEGATPPPAEGSEPKAGDQSAAPPAPAPEGKPRDKDKPKSELEQDMDNAAGRAVLGGGI